MTVQDSWLPWARFAGIDAEPLLGGSLYATLEHRYGVRKVRARQAFTAGRVSESETALLGLPAGSALLRITRTAYDGSNRQAEFGTSAMRPGWPSRRWRSAHQPGRGRTRGIGDTTGCAPGAQPEYPQFNTF